MDDLTVLAQRLAARRFLMPAVHMWNENYVQGHWLDILAHKLEDFEEAVKAGKRPRLMLFAPPQFGKSTVVSRAFPLWLLGRNPTWPIVVASYALSLPTGHGRWVRNKMQEKSFQHLFPDCELSTDSSAADYFTTTRGGYYKAIGVGGGLTGFPAKVAIIDDPVKDMADAQSEQVRQTTYDWYQTVLSTRIAPGGGVLLMMTRWSLADLAGSLLEASKASPMADQWDVLSFPAISDEGVPLFPERYSLDELERKRASMPAADWAALYQQNPVPDGGLIFKQEWWRYADELELQNIEPYRVIQSWDTAFQKNKTADTSSCITAKITKTGIYIVDHWQGRVEFPELKAMAISLAERWHPTEIIVEDKASGQSLIQEIQRETRLPVLRVKPDADKVTRARIVTPVLQSGRVFLPREAPWLAEWLHCFTTFPAGKIKDPVDSFTQLMTYLRFERIDDFVEPVGSKLAMAKDIKSPDAEEVSGSYWKDTGDMFGWESFSAL